MKRRVRVGVIQALFRYPVKSMRGIELRECEAGWHGLAGDRRMAFRRPGDRGGFPWLTATRCPGLLRYTPEVAPGASPDDLPSHILSPTGGRLPVFGPELDREIGELQGESVELTHLDRGIFDVASLSLISEGTIAHLSDLAGLPADVRRFRPNILLKTEKGLPCEEDRWAGGVLSFGEGAGAPALAVTQRDERCAMVNIHPESGQRSPELLKTIVRERRNLAGVYATVLRCGLLAAGQEVFFSRLLEEGSR